MPFFPMMEPMMFIIPLIGLLFVALLFVLLGIELQWRLRGILLLVLLVLASGLLGFVIVGSTSLIESMPKEVKLKDASDHVGFRVYVPKYLPEGMKIRRVEVMPGPPDFKGLSFSYSGLGDDLNLMESKNTGMIGLMFGPGPPGTKREKIKIKGRPARMFSDDSGFNSLSLEFHGISIEIQTTLPKNELIKVANSLTRQK